ncbi:MAG: DUF4190 domain-containing protein [Lachnospiraceae bacterium]|nr:DUF4190 domain-containing protein [Lachnospiraceae bacterium]
MDDHQFNQNNYNPNTYNQNGYQSPYSNPAPKRANGFAKSSFILGIISVITGFLFLIPIPFITSLLSIIFGFVSKRPGERMEGKAIVGISLSAVILITIIVLIFVVYQFLNTMAGVEFVNQFMAEYKEALKVYMEFYN